MDGANQQENIARSMEVLEMPTEIYQPNGHGDES